MTIRRKAFAALVVIVLLALASGAISFALHQYASELIDDATRRGLIAANLGAELQLRRQTAQRVLIALQVLLLAIAFATTVAANSTVLGPLRRLTAAAVAMAEGRTTRIPPVERDDEVGLLTNALSRMLATLSDREEELRSKHRELITTLETIPAAFILVDNAGNVRLQNRAATALVGQPPKGVPAMEKYRRDFKLVTRDRRELPPDQWPLAKALRGEIVKSDDLEIHTSHAATPLLAAAAPIRGVNDSIEGAVVAFQDVSALRAVDRMKDEFVSIVSHELRTPLTSIRGSLQLVLDEPDTVADDDHRQLLQVALNNCERLIRIINDILDVSKIESGKMQLQTAVADVRQLVDAARNVVAPVARAGRVELAVRMQDELPPLMVDGDRIVQALVNIMSNAVKFAPPDSIVSVEASASDAEVSVSVRDRGPGIAEADLSRLFRKFQQVDASASRRKGGTGLGLVITKAIVEQHGGRIDVQSTPGEGAQFTIVLPVTTTQPLHVPEIVERSAVPAGSTILVIDDDDEYRLVIRRHLERAGYRVVEAREGATGLQVAREVRPQAITLDLMMPGMSGWELLARLSEDQDLRATPVVIVSAVADHAYLAKPFDASELAQRLAQLVARS